MKLKDEKAWREWEAVNKDAYGACCISVARRVMERLDLMSDSSPIDADALVMEEGRKDGITGFMAGAVAVMVSRCHARGEEFRCSWNKQTQIGSEGDKANEKDGAVLNPALLSVGARRH